MKLAQISFEFLYQNSFESFKILVFRKEFRKAFEVNQGECERGVRAKDDRLTHHLLPKFTACNKFCQ